MTATALAPAPTAKGLPPDERIWIVLVDFNGLADTRKCLDSLAAVTDAASVVVVDNASKVDVTEALQPDYPWVDFVRSEVNGGWAGGNNLGVKHALAHGAEWIILLNNDTIVPPRFIARLMEAANTHPEYGVLGPVILFMDEPAKVQTTGVVFNRPDRAGFFQPIAVPHDAEKPIQVVDCDIVNGCCLMIRRDVVEAIGFVDEQFFLIHEESDWCLRAQKVTKLGVVTDGLVWHKGSSTFKREGSKLQRYFDARNLIRLLWKHRRRPSARRVGAGYQHFFTYAYHRYAIEREAGHLAAAEAVLEGVYDGLTGAYGPLKLRSRPGLGIVKRLVSWVWNRRST